MTIAACESVAARLPILHVSDLNTMYQGTKQTVPELGIATNPISLVCHVYMKLYLGRQQTQLQKNGMVID